MSDDSANNDPISSALNMVPLDGDKQLVNLIDNAFSQSAESDFELARTNIMELIQTGTVSLERLSEIAAQSQHPRAFEVVSTMINTLLVANEKLLEMQVKIRQLNALDGKGSNETPQVINNNLFVGSTQELLKTLRNMKVDDGTASDISG